MNKGLEDQLTILDAILLTSWLEWLAVLTGVIYVILAARRNILCWYFALVSSAIYIYICLSYQLYIETALQFFYVIMAVIGWLTWKRDSGAVVVQNTDILDDLKESKEEIRTWRLTSHLINILVSGAIAAALGYFFDHYTDQANPYMDAFTTVYSLSTTYMVTKKILENWIYWVIIDMVSILLYYDRGLHLTSLLYGFFTILATAGFIAWFKKYKAQKA